MDLGGVRAAVCFPSFPRLRGTVFLDGEGKELALAYNDFVLDEWSPAAPDRLIPMVILPLWDVGGCFIDYEVYRMVELIAREFFHFDVDLVAASHERGPLAENTATS